VNSIRIPSNILFRHGYPFPSRLIQLISVDEGNAHFAVGPDFGANSTLSVGFRYFGMSLFRRTSEFLAGHALLTVALTAFDFKPVPNCTELKNRASDIAHCDRIAFCLQLRPSVNRHSAATTRVRIGFPY
jgi:hypothetical protein